MMTVCEGWASPGFPPTGPLDYCTISLHALAESLGDIRAPISHMAAFTLPPLPLTLALKISFCTVQVCTCTRRYFLISKLIRITITGMWFDIVLSQWHIVRRKLSRVFLKGHTLLFIHMRSPTPRSLRSACSRASVSFSRTVYLRNNFYKILSLKNFWM